MNRCTLSYPGFLFFAFFLFLLTNATSYATIQDGEGYQIVPQYNVDLGNNMYLSSQSGAEEWVKIDQGVTGENESSTTSCYNHGEEQISECRICIINNGTGQVKYTYTTQNDDIQDHSGSVELGGTAQFETKMSSRGYELKVEGKNAVVLVYKKPTHNELLSVEETTLSLSGARETSQLLSLPDENILEGNDPRSFDAEIANTGNQAVCFGVMYGQQKVAYAQIPPKSTKRIQDIRLVPGESYWLNLGVKKKKSRGCISWFSFGPKGTATVTVYERKNLVAP